MGAHRTHYVCSTLAGVLAHETRRTLARRVRPRRPADGAGPTHAVALREALEKLGPFYIKIGQILSTRPDLVSPEVIAELEMLHDRVSVAPFTVFEPVLTRDLGPRWPAFFRHIDTEHPLGAASLAQVYRATLTDGTPAALKIQRPGIRPVIEADMKLLNKAARFVGRRAPRFTAVIDTHAMLGVIFDAMRPELDFTLEARNMHHAREHITGFKHLAVPAVISATPNVLVQTLAPGCSIADARRADFTLEEREGIGRDLMAFMYRSYFLTRSFHADPHPGNILVHPGEKAHLIDWGMVGRIDRPLSTSILLVLLSLAQNDGAAVAKAWIEMGHATPWAEVTDFIEDMAALVPQVATATLEELNFGVTLTKILEQSTRRGIKTSPMISVLGKSFANLEGSIRNLCPELAIIDVFEDEFRHIAFKLATEALSEKQAARIALDLIIAGNTVAPQARGLLRDLSNREFTVQVNQLPLKRALQSLPFGGRHTVRDAALALGALAWWKRHRHTPGR
ncbi:ABC1 kinase family protein [Streptomyces paromomycinus]|uniref:ATP/GTP-binding protein n=1 Tax=Streptomyces paromomycinus TaxID=92743 RepID=A0A401VXV1_STREY|nr:AarF/UbiB family protein [Streptomyces paromomycinus]GCD41913.1 ATP/GTP-binding protein [Streptomyces paromomycinus]